MTTKHTLYEGVLNDDYMTVEQDGSVLITYYTYATEWSNVVHEKCAYDMERALAWYKNKFPDRVKAQGEEWIGEDTDDYNDIKQTPQEYWKNVVMTQGMEI